MTRYFLGVDVGATKTHALIADETGRACGFGESGPGNHEVVGYAGLEQALQTAAEQALRSAGVPPRALAGAGFGIGGYDWPSEREDTLAAIATLGLSCPLEVVNDTIVGLLAGAASGWGVGLIGGTGNNCWGWTRDRSRMGHVTGNGMYFGEYGGASELVWKARCAVAAEYTCRGPATALTPAFIKLTGAASLEELLDGLSQDRYDIGPAAAPLVFEVARAGDPIARAVIEWDAEELASLACGVIRQLDVAAEPVEVVLIGSLYNGGDLLLRPLLRSIRAVAPRAELVRLTAPPVVGAVLLGMEQAGLARFSLRGQLMESTSAFLKDRALWNDGTE